MKKTLAIIVSAALVTALSAGATLAYFTSTDNVANKVTMGNVNVSVSEAVDTDYVNASGLVVPNQILKKEVTIKHNGNVPAYLRVKLAKSWTNKDGSTADATKLTSKIILMSGASDSYVDHVDDGWVNVKDTDYYVWGKMDTDGKTIIPSAILSTTTPIAKPITAFRVDSTADNDTYNGLVAHVDVTANEIQVTGLAPEDLSNWLKGIDVK